MNEHQTFFNVSEKKKHFKGFGNVGTYTTRFLCQAGAICVGVQEWNCSLQNPNGIDPIKLDEWRNQHAGNIQVMRQFPSFKEEVDLQVGINSWERMRSCWNAPICMRIHATSFDRRDFWKAFAKRLIIRVPLNPSFNSLIQGFVDGSQLKNIVVLIFSIQNSSTRRNQVGKQNKSDTSNPFWIFSFVVQTIFR